MKTLWACNFTVALVGLVCVLHASAAGDQLQVSLDRWIEVRSPIGQVLYSRGQTSRPARNGMRLQAVGDTISTKQGSSAVLTVDLGKGLIKVAENTTVTVNNLLTGKGGERITQLHVKAGQVRLQVRPFTNSASRLEINTPAGVAGVRGTEFGVSVQQNGKMGVATLKGSVATAAQGQTVLVAAGFQNVTIPGESPSAPVPLQEDTRLNIRQLIAQGKQVRVVGSIDPVNLLFINKQPQNTDIKGNFDIAVPLLPNRQVEAVVVTPLGSKQLYELAVP